MPTKVHEATAETPVAEVVANGHGPASSDLASVADILALDDVRYEVVPVPEWHRDVRLVSLNGVDRNRVAVAQRVLAKKLRLSEDEENTFFQAHIILASWVDGEGRHVGDQSQAEALMRKSGAALTRLWLVCRRLSGLGTEEVDEAVDDLKATPSGDTGSD